MRRRSLQAAMLSPLASIPVFVVWFAAFYFFFRPPEEIIDSWMWLPIFLGYVLAIAYIGSFVVGIPVDWLLRRIRLQHPATYALVGFVIGGAIGVNMFEPSYLSAVIALSGLAVSISFGLISNAQDETII